MVKKYKNNRKAFSLVEVLTATIVMTMMLVSVIAYIQYGSLVWQKGQTKIAAKNYSRMAFDLLKQDLLRAKKIVEPPASSLMTFNNIIEYELPGAPGTFKVGAPSENILRRALSGGSLADKEQWEVRIARNVSYFGVERLSTWTLKIHLQIRSDEEVFEDVNLDGAVDILDREIVSSESIVLTAPAAGG